MSNKNSNTVQSFVEIVDSLSGDFEWAYDNTNGFSDVAFMDHLAKHNGFYSPKPKCYPLGFHYDSQMTSDRQPSKKIVQLPPSRF